MGQLDASIVTLAFPTLSRQFGAGIAAVQWVGLAYLLVLAVALPLVGRLADAVGHKLLYTYGFVIFIAGSALCGLAPGLLALDGFRMLQALGAAMLQANSVAIIAGVMPARKLGRGIGVQGAAQALGLALGPVAGGLLIALGGWRLIFFVNLPVGLIGTVLGWYLLPRTRQRSGDARFDWLGAALLLPAIGALFLVFSLGGTLGWTSPATIGLFVLALAAGAAFLALERRAAAPILRPDLLRVRAFTLGLANALGMYMVLFGILFVVPFYLEGSLGATPATAGVELLSMPAALGLAAPFAGRLADRVGARLPIVLGMTLGALALAVAALVPGDTVVLLLALAVLGVGLGFSVSPNNAATVGDVPEEHTGVASGVLNMTRSVGTAMGLSITGSVFASVAGAATSPDLVAAGFRVALWFLVAVALATAVSALFLGGTKLRPGPSPAGG